MLRRISQWLGRGDSSLDSTEETTEDAHYGVDPYLGVVGSAERQQFPPEELETDEHEESE